MIYYIVLFILLAVSLGIWFGIRESRIKAKWERNKITDRHKEKTKPDLSLALLRSHYGKKNKWTRG